MTPVPRHASLWLLVPAAIAVAALLLGLVLTRERPMEVAVDGVRLFLVEGTTVGDLERTHALTARPGRLLSVTGSVIETQGGAPARIFVDGHPAEADQYVLRRNVLESRDGSDTVEATVTLREPLPLKTRIVGSGPVMRLANTGSVGVRARIIGEKSKVLVSEQIEVPAQDMVVVRTRPHPQEKLIALTFDDGPWPGQTDKILKILEHEGVHATFFMLGVRVKAAPDLARKVAMAGNQVGNHSLGHRWLTKIKPKQIRKQIDGGANAILKATGVRATWFRPPYGAINAATWRQLHASRLHVALWDIDTRDWSHPGVGKIVRAATKNPRPGSIILMHDGGVNRAQTIKALPLIISRLKKQGYVFVTLQELAEAR